MSHSTVRTSRASVTWSPSLSLSLSFSPSFYRVFVSVDTVSQSCSSCCPRPVEGRSHCLRAFSSSCSPARFPLRNRCVRREVYHCPIRGMGNPDLVCCLPQVEAISADWAARADLPQYVVQMVDNFPNSLHPMSQFSAAISAMQLESKFARAYNDGLHKSKYWEVVSLSSLPPSSLPLPSSVFLSHLVA